MTNLKPLTKSLLQKLIDCRAKELKGNGHCSMQDLRYAVAPLYKRGLIGTKEMVVNNKVLMGVFVTQAGIDLLKRIDKKNK
ncbi:MAG: hypothetical protein ABI091_06235 [Ferruginibacter sp.]